MLAYRRGFDLGSIRRNSCSRSSVLFPVAFAICVFSVMPQGKRGLRCSCIRLDLVALRSRQSPQFAGLSAVTILVALGSARCTMEAVVTAALLPSANVTVWESMAR
jgi:hypothetical protein